MQIVSVGFGELGRHYARHWVAAGHEVRYTFVRDRDRAAEAAAALGELDYVEPGQIGASADVVLFAPRFEHFDQARDVVGGLAGKIVIDANNPLNPARDGPARLQAGETAAGIVAGLFPRARIVKALHNLGVQTILSHREGQLAGFVASDDAGATEIVSGLVSGAKLVPIVTGGLRTAALSEFPGPLYGHAFNPNAARRELSRLLAVSA